MSQSEVKKTLHELKVNELRNVLEKRGMDKTGIKAILIDRLDQALKAEGHDVQTYRFGMAELQSTQQLEGKTDNGTAPNEMTAIEAKQNGEYAAVVVLGGNDVEMATEEEVEQIATANVDQQNAAPIGQQPNSDGTTPAANVEQQQQAKQPMEKVANVDTTDGRADGPRNDSSSAVALVVADNAETVPAAAGQQPHTTPIGGKTVATASGGDEGEDTHGDEMDFEDEPDIIIETPEKVVKTECVEDVVLVSPTACASTVGSAVGGGVGVGNGIKSAGEVLTVTATAAIPSSNSAVPSSMSSDQQPKQLNAAVAVTPGNGVGTAATPATTSAITTTMAQSATAPISLTNVPPQQQQQVTTISTTNPPSSAVTTMPLAASSSSTVSAYATSSSGDDVILINGDQQQDKTSVVIDNKETVAAAQPTANETTCDGGKKQSSATGGGPVTTAQLVNGNNLSSSLWIRNITTTTKAADLKALFSKHGKVITAKIFTTKNKQSPTCFGYVTLADAETANVCAQKLNRSNFKGRIINVEKADRSNLSQIGTQQQQQQRGDDSAATDATAKTSGGAKGAGSSGGKGSGAEASAASSSSSKKVRPRITAVTESPTQRNRNSGSTKAAANTSSRTSIRKRIAKNGADNGGGTASKYDSLSRNQRRYFRSRIATSFGQRGGVDGVAPSQYIVKSRSAAESRHIYGRVVHQTSRGIRVSAFEAGGHHYGGAQQHSVGGGGFRDFSSRRGPGPGGAVDSRRFGAANDEREEMLRLMEQREEEYRKKEEELRLEREREKLKYEREKLERERLEVEHMKLTAQIQASGWLQAAALPAAAAAAGGFVAAPPAGFGGPAAVATTTGQQSARDSRQPHSRQREAAPTRSITKLKESSSSSKLSSSVAGRASVAGRTKESSSSRAHNDTRRASSDRDRAMSHHQRGRSRSRSPIRRSSTRSDKNNNNNLSSSSTATWQSKSAGGSLSSSSRHEGKQRDSGGGRGKRSNSRGRGGTSSSHYSQSSSSYGQQQFGGTAALNPFSQPQPFGGGSSGGALSFGKQQQYSVGGGSSRMTSSSAVSAGGGAGYERHGQLQGRSYYSDRYADATAGEAYASRTDPSYGQRMGQQFSNSGMGAGGTRDEMFGVTSGGGNAFSEGGYATSSAQFGSSRGHSSGGGGQPSSSYYSSQSSAWANGAGASRATEMVNSRAFGMGTGGTSTGGGWSRQTDDILSEWNMYGSPSKMTASSSGRYHQQQSLSSYSGGGGRSGGGGGSIYTSGGGGRRY